MLEKAGYGVKLAAEKRAGGREIVTQMKCDLVVTEHRDAAARMDKKF